MGYNEDQDIINVRPMQLKIEIEDEIDQVVPSVASCPTDYDISCDESSLDVLYVN